MRKRALLINPPTGLYIREDRCQAPLKGMAMTTPRPPLDLAYMAATLEKTGVECRIGDYPAAGQDWSALARDLREFRPDMLVISVTSFTIGADLKAATMAREELGRSVMTIAKGAHISVKAGEVLAAHPDVDVALRGEYEFTVAELARAADPLDVPGVTCRAGEGGAVVSSPDRPFLDDLDSLPFPARHLLDNSLYLRPDTDKPQTTVQTSRGCGGSCIFCLTPSVYGSRIRFRSPANVVAELDECVKKHGIDDFFFRADTFTWNRKWVLDLCRMIVDRGLDFRWVCNSRVDTIDDERLEWMKRAGCEGVAFGIEAGTQEMLDRMKKGITLEKAREAVALCRKHGVMILLYFVMGLPWDTAESIRASADFALELGGDFVEFHIAVPFPGTELYDIAVRDGLYIPEALDGYDYSRSPLKTYTLSSEQLLGLRREVAFRLYLSPRSLMRMAGTIFRHFRSPGRLVRVLIFGARKLWYLLGKQG